MRLIGSLTMLIATAGGCFAPPALLPAKAMDLAAVLPRYPIGTQTVNLEVEPGVSLRGVFVPSDADAPIVLHLLESSGSCAAERLDFGQVTRQLSDLGFASLILDYTGVGASDGDVSVAHLERDASAMWEEAARRAGSESRVYLRATSLGTIAAALLLKRGARPAGIVLIAPVLADSATERFARAFHGGLASWAAAVLFRDIADVDVVAELTKTKVPVLVVTADEDVLLAELDRQRVASAVDRENSGMFVRAGGHLQICVDAHVLMREELVLFAPACSTHALEARIDGVLKALPAPIAERFVLGTEERQRLERLAALQLNSDPLEIAAAAISIPSASVAARLLWLVAQSPYPELDFDERCAVFSLHDPAGDLPIELVEAASRPRDFGNQLEGGGRILTAEEIAQATRSHGLHAGDLGWDVTATVVEDQSVQIRHDSAAVWLALLDRGLSQEDLARQFIRIHLKANRIPDRLHTDANGKVLVEAEGDQGWTLLDPARLPPPRKAFTMKFPKF